ncbi:MAG: GAF domain-containing sensor histidine kinase [Anaeromyxobacteraceae bacterium]
MTYVSAEELLPGDPAGAILLEAAAGIAGAHELERLTEIVRRSARALLGADGVTFVLREGGSVHYADEDAIAPLWKGRRFPVDACVSGWAMLHATPVVIPDVFADDRVPHDLYRPTFVRSLVMVPVRPEAPVAAIGAYWAVRRQPTAREVQLLEALAALSSTALANLALEAELRHALAARDELIDVASHELRTPLSALRLQVDRARLRPEADQAGLPSGWLERMDRSVGRLDRLVASLLDVSRQHREPFHLEREPVDLREVARDVVDAFQGTPGAEIALYAPAPVHGAFDRARIGQVLENLLANAVKFGRGRPVELRLEALPGEVRMTVRDEGIGIALEDQARIFDRFTRAVSRRSYGGLGLGLWIARRAVEAHGGTLSVESREGEGATFRVALPLESAAA